MDEVQKLTIEDKVIAQCYRPYSRQLFRQHILESIVDGWSIQFLAVSSVKMKHKPPILILDGSFQNYSSYKYHIEQLVNCAPVILVNMPLFGINTQTSNSVSGQSIAELDLKAYCDILAKWLQKMKIAEVMLLGLNTGSVVATQFAAQLPYLVERLALISPRPKIDAAYKAFIKEVLALKEQNQVDELAQILLLNLVNFSQLDQTGMSESAIKSLYQQLSTFDENEFLRFQISCQHLLKLDQLPAVQVKTLVVAAEHDSFITPYKQSEFAMRCSDAQFAVIENADYLMLLQRRLETLNLLTAFFGDQALDQIQGVRLLTVEQQLKIDRRVSVRRHLEQPYCQMQLANKEFVPVYIDNIDYFGACCHFAQHENDIQQPLSGHSSLRFSDAMGIFDLACTVVESNQDRLHLVFKHRQIALAERFVDYLKQNKSSLVSVHGLATG